jgi:DNA-binding XRE family transcriptional regulator
MAWEVEATDQFLEWWQGLSTDQQESVTDRVDLLAGTGPDLGRPVVDLIRTSRHQHMKELRAAKSGALRVLFMFDPRRQVIPPAGGRQKWRVEHLVRVGGARSRQSVRRLPERTARRRVDLMARTKFSELRAAVESRPGAQDRLAAKRAETLDEIRLYELRHGAAVSQAELAGRLDVTQGAISKLEHAEDVRVSTLRQYLDALGARLELVAVFDDEARRVPVHLGKLDGHSAV